MGHWLGPTLSLCPSGTNINNAVLLAVELLDRSNQAELLPSKSVSLIILLTDGDPTVGEDTVAIPGHVRRGARLDLLPGWLWNLRRGQGESLRPLWL